MKLSAESIYTPSVKAALDRGREDLNEYISLLEHGTAEEIAKWEWERGAQITMDMLRARAARDIWLEENRWKFIGTGDGLPW